MAKITDKGYEIKSANDYFDDEIALYKQIDPDWQLTIAEPDGIKAAADSEVFATLDQMGLAAYNSKDPAKASGTALDSIASISNMKRNQGDHSYADVIITQKEGSSNTIIRKGKRIKSTADGSIWEISKDTLLYDNDETPAVVVCSVIGPTPASPNVITEIIDNVNGWAAVTNPNQAVVGAFPETDQQLRERRDKTLTVSGRNQLESVFSAILSVNGVLDAKVYENNTAETDEMGIPSGGIAVVALGGDDYDIAGAYYIRRNPATIMHPVGTKVSVEYSHTITINGRESTDTQTIIFSRPISVPVAIAIDITDPEGVVTDDVIDDIKDAIILYVNGSLLEDCAEGFRNRRYKIGDDVAAGQIYTPVNSVIGSLRGSPYIATLTVNSGNYVDIDSNEVSSFTKMGIEVTTS